MSEKRQDAERVLNAFRRLVKVLRVADRAGLKNHGLGASQTFVLHELNRESPLSINELAARTATDQSTVSVVVNKLVAKGYVNSSRSDSDARRAALALTEKGQEAVQKLPPPIQHLLLSGTEKLEANRIRDLADMLEQIVGDLGDDSERPPMFFEDDVPPATRRR